MTITGLTIVLATIVGLVGATTRPFRRWPLTFARGAIVLTGIVWGRGLGPTLPLGTVVALAAIARIGEAIG